MKIKELVDAGIELPDSSIVVEIGNGQQLATTGFWVRTNSRNEKVIVLKTGKKIKGSKK